MSDILVMTIALSFIIPCSATIVSIAISSAKNDIIRRLERLETAYRKQ